MPPKSASAIAAGVLGVITPFGGFFFPPIPILAVIFGHMGLKEIKAGYREGRGMALTGIFFGWIAISFYVITGTIWIGFMSRVTLFS